MKKMIVLIGLTLASNIALADSYNLLCTFDVKYPTITEDVDVLIEDVVSNAQTKKAKLGNYKFTVNADMTDSDQQLVQVSIEEEKMSEHGYIQTKAVASWTINMQATLMGPIHSADMSVRNIRTNCHLALID